MQLPGPQDPKFSKPSQAHLPDHCFFPRRRPAGRGAGFFKIVPRASRKHPASIPQDVLFFPRGRSAKKIQKREKTKAFRKRAFFLGSSPRRCFRSYSPTKNRVFSLCTMTLVAPQGTVGQAQRSKLQWADIKFQENVQRPKDPWGQRSKGPWGKDPGTQ